MTSASLPPRLLLLLSMAWALVPVFARQDTAVDLTAMPRAPFVLHESFEETDPVRLWEANGKFTVRYKGLTGEHAHHGARSFKLDIAFAEDGECFWRIPVAVPLEGRMHQSLHWRAGRHSDAEEVGMGYAIVFAPTDRWYRRDTCILRGKDRAGRPLDWQRCAERFMTPGHPHDPMVTETRGGRIGMRIVGVTKYDIGVAMDPVIRIKGRTGQRAVLYLDDLRIEGEAPDPVAYREAVRARYAGAAAPLHRQLQTWRERLNEALSRLRGLGELPAPVLPCLVALEGEAARQLARLDAVIADGYAGWQELDPIIDTLWAAEHSVDGFRTLPGEKAAPELVHYRVRALSNTPVRPQEIPTAAALGGDLEGSACRGEIEPVSFAVHALTDLADLRLDISDLSGPGAIPAGAVDPFVVKAWYTAGFYKGDPHGRFLVPDLLLKDDALVRVDTENQHNYLRSTAEDGAEEYILCSGPTSEALQNIRPRDAKALQPVSVPAGTTKAFWLTVHVPEEAAPGNYRGTVTLRWSGEKTHRIPLRLHVLPFDLPPSPLIYSIFNRSRIGATADPHDINTEYLTVERYEREIRNLVEHGILYPNSYDGFALLRPALEARRRAGVATERFYSVDLAYRVRVATQDGKEGRRELRKRIAEWKPVLEEFGYRELWVMGIDEARGPQLKAQRPAVEAVHEAGARCWAAATHETTFGVIGDLLDMAVMAGVAKPSELRKWHGGGKEVFCYGAPQTEWEQPEIYRRNYGLVLWQTGYDGAMIYAYRHGMGHVWNDFDHPRRDHTLVYPTADGLIDTIAWEGVREGIDDTRYMAALQQAISAAADPGAAGRAQAWLDELSLVANMDEIRSGTVEWILRLR